MPKNVYQELIEANRHLKEDALEELNLFAKTLIEVGVLVSIKFKRDDYYLALPADNVLVKNRLIDLEKIRFQDVESGEHLGWKWLEYRYGTYRLGDNRGSMRELLSKYITDRPDIYQ